MLSRDVQLIRLPISGLAHLVIELFLDRDSAGLLETESSSICSFRAFDRRKSWDLENGGYLKTASLMGNMMINHPAPPQLP